MWSAAAKTEKSHLMLWIGKEKPKQCVCVPNEHESKQIYTHTQTNATTFDKFAQVVRHWCCSAVDARFTHISIYMVYWAKRKKNQQQQQQQTLTPIYCFYLLTINRRWTNICQWICDCVCSFNENGWSNIHSHKIATNRQILASVREKGTHRRRKEEKEEKEKEAIDQLMKKGSLA